MKSIIKEFYGNHSIQSSNFGKIINNYHFNRLCSLLKNAQKNNKILCGGDIDESKSKIALTLIEIDNDNDPLLKDELFGPLLPILTISNLTEVTAGSGVNQVACTCKRRRA